jgi:hypothetical protein
LHKNTFKFYRPNGSYVSFNIDSLVQYILATGDFSDPESRIPFSESDLETIDSLASEAGLSVASVLSAKKDIHAFSDLKFRRDALLGLERLAGEVITEMLRTIENYDPDEAQMRLLLRDFPSFADLFRQIQDVDQEYARNSMLHWKLFLQGPPNNLNVDDFGLIDITLQFLDSLQNSRRGEGGGAAGVMEIFGMGLSAMGLTLGQAAGDHVHQIPSQGQGHVISTSSSSEGPARVTMTESSSSSSS